MLQNASEGFRMHQNASGRFRMLQIASECFRMYQKVSVAVFNFGIKKIVVVVVVQALEQARS